MTKLLGCDKVLGFGVEAVRHRLVDNSSASLSKLDELRDQLTIRKPLTR